MTPPIPFFDMRGELAAIRPAIDAAIARVLDHGGFVGGAEVEAFERALAAATGAAHAVGTSSGTDALLAIAMALGWGPGDETGTPVDLLKAVGYAQTRWQQVIGEAELEGAPTHTGVMGLTPDHLARGAALTGYGADDLAASAEANILAAAKLLAEEAAAQGVRGGDLAAWFAAVPRRGAATAIVTHGEDEARASYAALLGDRFGAPTIVPALDQTIALP